MNPASLASFALLALCWMIFSGCSGLGGHGPSASDIRSKESGYTFVPVSSYSEIPSAQNLFLSSGAPPENAKRRYIEELTPRDKIQILITDASSESSPYYRSGGAYTYGPVEVPQSGKIKIPYIGEIFVLDRILSDISSEISEKVKTVSASAEATVNRPFRLAKRANVLGEVSKPGAFTIDRKNLTVVDLLAASGGTRGSEHLYIFTLKRDGVDYVYDSQAMRSVAFLVEDGDLLSVVKNPNRAFFVSGSVNRPGRFDFPNESPTLADALAYGAGLNEYRSNPKGVFVFRTSENGKEYAYGVDMKEANAASISRRFMLEGGDSIYVSEAPLTQWNRFIGSVLPVGQAARVGVSTAATASGIPGI